MSFPGTLYILITDMPWTRDDVMPRPRPVLVSEEHSAMPAAQSAYRRHKAHSLHPDGRVSSACQQDGLT